MKIGNWDSVSGRAFIIAEVGCNHEGNLARASAMIIQVVQAGADAVKFQVYDPDLLVPPDMPALGHAQSHKTQLERMRAIQLDYSEYRALARMAEAEGLIWTASAYDRESVDLVAELSPVIKIGSGELTNVALIKYAASKGRPLIIATGMGSQEEIGQAIAASSEADLALLHCVSLYPAEHGQLGLVYMPELGAAWRHRIVFGYSDHSIGGLACVVAVAMGARIVEKHFTDLLPGEREKVPGDHRHSLNEGEFETMVKQIRAVEAMRRPWIGPRPDLASRRLLRRNLATGLRGG